MIELFMVTYVRAKKASMNSSNIETLYHMFDFRVEAIEFRGRIWHPVWWRRRRCSRPAGYGNYRKECRSRCLVPRRRSAILYLPTALEVDTFAHGQAEMIKFKVPEENLLASPRYSTEDLIHPNR